MTKRAAQPPPRAARAPAAADAFMEAVVQAAAERVLAQLPAAEPVAEWLDVDGAAAHCKCSRHRIYRLVSMGRIPHEHEGARLLFERAELDAWIRAGGAK